jgi:hypothetical protein
MSHVNKVQPIRVKMLRIAAIRVSVTVNVPGVTSRYGTAYKVVRNIPQRKDIYMSINVVVFDGL